MAAPASTARPDVGLSHVALTAANLEASLDFYSRYAGLQAVHRRGDPGSQVAWLSDGSRNFVLVLVEDENVAVRLEGTTHLGVGCRSRSEVDRLCALARRDRCLVRDPEELGPPVGYMALLQDPDGHNLELSYGQHVAAAVEASHSGAATEPTALPLRQR